MTLTIESPQVYTQLGVAISVTGIAQVYNIRAQNFPLVSPSRGQAKNWHALCLQINAVNLNL